MKKLFAISVFLNVALALGVSWKELAVHAAAGGGGIPIGNGDVNGDGTINISDGIYILSWLFTGGSAPLPIDCPRLRGGLLPATGITKCESNGEFEVACDSADFPGQDGFYRAGCPAEGRFVDNGDGTVTDTCTSLIWQKETQDVSGDGSLGFEDALTWRDALIYCESLSFAGNDDWRLPNVRELESIVDYGKSNNFTSDPIIDTVFSAVPDWYWSSSGWGVNFNGGVTQRLEIRDRGAFVRAVRGGL